MAKRNDEYRMNMIATFQKNLANLMMSRGWENTDLSMATGIGLSDLSKYRNIEYNVLPRVTEIAKICEAFHVTLDFMVGIDPGGRYAELTVEEKEILSSYALADDRDKMLVKTILFKNTPDS